MNILEACKDRELFARQFESDSWGPWFAFLAAAFGLPVKDKDMVLYQQCTERTTVPSKPVREAWMIVGRRGGKSRITALMATFLATFFDYRPYLAPGEWGLVSVIASDRSQARVIFRYIEAFILQTPMLAELVTRQTATVIELSNRIAIEVTSASIKSTRGYTIVAALCDEIAFWRSEDSANPAADILNAIRPAMATIPNAMLISLTSPYGMFGVVYSEFRRSFGRESQDILVWKAPTWVMNPAIDQSFLDRERERDPVAFRSEYGAEFRSDIASALDPDWVEQALCLPNLDAPRSPHDRSYKAFADMSGGRRDSATLAVAHMEPDQPQVFVDCVRRWPPPFSPEGVVEQMAEVCKQYGVHAVTGDNYSAELTVELFRKAGLGYMRSELSASDLYLQAIPLFSTGTIHAPDHGILRAELLALERRTRVSGKDLISHPPGSHDDLANSACGAAVNAWRSRPGTFNVILGAEAESYYGEGCLTPGPEYDGHAPWRWLS